MTRKVTTGDAARIAGIFDHYMLHDVATFGTGTAGEEETRRRIGEISSCHPYLVYEQDGRVMAAPTPTRGRSGQRTAHMEDERLHLKPGFRKVSHLGQEGQKFGRLLDVTDWQMMPGRQGA